MRTFFILLTVIIGIVLSINALAGPFGLEKGMSLEEIGGDPVKLERGKYQLTVVPKPHSSFILYSIRVAPKEGLYFVKAVCKPISTSSYGFELKEKFKEMVERVGTVYGSHKTTDVLLPNSIWSNPNEWMTALSKKERVLMAVWEKNDGANLPDDIKSIYVAAQTYGNSRDEGFVAIEYCFTNFDAGEAEISAAEDDVL